MKKVICIILVLVTMAGCSLAAEVDVTALTDEEFVDLYTKMVQELVNRKLEKTAHLKSGMYFGGKDIPVGEYTLSIDNSQNDQPVFIGFITSEKYAGFNGMIPEKSTYQRPINIVEDCRLEVRCDFELILAPRGMVMFE